MRYTAAQNYRSCWLFAIGWLLFTAVDGQTLACSGGIVEGLKATFTCTVLALNGDVVFIQPGGTTVGSCLGTSGTLCGGTATGYDVTQAGLVTTLTINNVNKGNDEGNWTCKHDGSPSPAKNIKASVLPTSVITFETDPASQLVDGATIDATDGSNTLHCRTTTCSLLGSCGIPTTMQWTWKYKTTESDTPTDFPVSLKNDSAEPCLSGGTFKYTSGLTLSRAGSGLTGEHIVYCTATFGSLTGVEVKVNFGESATTTTYTIDTTTQGGPPCSIDDVKCWKLWLIVVCSTAACVFVVCCCVICCIKRRKNKSKSTEGQPGSEMTDNTINSNIGKENKAPPMGSNIGSERKASPMGGNIGSESKAPPMGGNIGSESNTSPGGRNIGNESKGPPGGRYTTKVNVTKSQKL